MNKAKEKLASASKLIRHKELPSLLSLKQLWRNASPNKDCDLVITFPPSSPEHVVLWHRKQLERITGLIVLDKRLVVSIDGKNEECHSFHISSTFEGYLKGLVLMQVPKLVREDCGGGWTEFNLKEAQNFIGIESLESFLTTQERQSINMFLISTLRTEVEETICDLKFRKGEAIFPKSLRCKLIHQIIPLHDVESLKYLQKHWVKNVFSTQPLEKIREYFGIQIGYYFAWLGHYTSALTIPAVIGVLFWLFLCGRDDYYEEIGFIVFAIFNVIWSTLFLTSWKRKSSVLSYLWGADYDKDEEVLKGPRPLFRGEERISEITKEPILYYPAWKRNLIRYFITVPVITICLFFVCVALFLILELQQWFNATFSSEGYQSFFHHVPNVLLAIIIPIMDNVYYKVAFWLNDLENYRLQEDYEDNLILKLISFQFVNSFLSLFYSAFYLRDMDKLKELLATLLITRQVIGNVKEALLPFLKKEFKIASLFLGESQDPEKKVVLSQIEIESTAPEYEGTFDDFLEMVIQFGYVTLFSASYPLAGFFALLNNVIEVRSDAFKLCMVCRRPFGQRVKGIGSWSTVMDMMGAIGVVVNCALIALPGRIVAPGISPMAIIFGALVLEHLLFLMKSIISYSIPDVPLELMVQKSKTEYKKKQMRLDGILSETFSNPSPSKSIEVVTADIGTQTYFRPLISRESDDSGSDSKPEPVVPSIRVSRSPSSTLEKNKKLLMKRDTIGEFQLQPVNKTQKKSEPELLVRTPEFRSKSPDGRKRHYLMKNRIASDTDLWTSVNYGRGGGSPGLTSLAEHDDNDIEASKIIVNQIKMPSVDEESFPSPEPIPEKKTLNQEEVIRKLKAKQALFSKGRSLSLASFKLSSSSKPKIFNFNNHSGNSSHLQTPQLAQAPSSAPIIENKKDDETYLAKNTIRGELDLLNLDKLINVHDLRKKST